MAPKNQENIPPPKEMIGNRSRGSVDRQPKLPVSLVMMKVLEEMGVHEYEPGVLRRMAEYSFHCIDNVLKDAKMLSTLANKTTVGDDELKLALAMQKDKEFLPKINIA